MKWLSSVPILILCALVAIVSVQAGCSDGDDCEHTRSHSCNSNDEDFLKKVNPFD